MALSSLGNGLDKLVTKTRKNPFSRLNTGRTNVGNVERWASVLGGAALAALALRRRSKGAVGLAALAGAPLLWRGATGHCPVYQKLGVDRAGHDGLTGRSDEGLTKPLDDATESLPVTTTEPIGQTF